MGRINKANLKRTIYYLKRNGLRKTWYAVLERLEERRQPPYVWQPLSEEELAAQRARWGQLWQTGQEQQHQMEQSRQQGQGQRAGCVRQTQPGLPAMFSILVPVYRTKPEYLRELLDSLCSQTYPGWELILADATEDDSVERLLRESPGTGCGETGQRGAGNGDTGWDGSGHEDVTGMGTCGADTRIRYVHLERNAGIAENTNQALAFVTGDYIGLLDHDDILTPDALHEMAAAIERERERGLEPAFLYSDEDKCNGDRTEYYEPNFKEDFNLDLLLSNNYICHFLVMKRELMQNLRFRPEYDGAQDYDLVLRAAAELGMAAFSGTPGGRAAIVHIPKVLYHWRCHLGSTAENPESKRYAYEAGRRALQDFADSKGWAAKAVDTAHVGFYSLQYHGDIFDSRPDLGAVGGRLTRKGRICGGRMTEEGKVVYENLPVHYSGYLHRAVLPQDAEAVDLRNIRVRPECRELFRKITSTSYKTAPGTDGFDASLLPEGSDIRQLSLEFCKALRAAGYRILYSPELEGKGIGARVSTEK